MFKINYLLLFLLSNSADNNAINPNPTAEEVLRPVFGNSFLLFLITTLLLVLFLLFNSVFDTLLFWTEVCTGLLTSFSFVEGWGATGWVSLFSYSNPYKLKCLASIIT